MCIPALSITITDFGPGYGLQWGMTSCLMNSSNISAFIAPRKTMHVIYPSTVIAGKKDKFSAFCVGTFEMTRLPFGPRPFLCRPSFEFMPDSSIKMSWSARHWESFTIQCSRRIWSRSLASSWSYKVSKIARIPHHFQGYLSTVQKPR